MTRVLVVDDDPDQVEIRKLLLERSGYEVDTAVSAEEALRLLSQSPPRLVVMDLRLPRAEDGQTLIRTIRELSPATRILVLTGWSSDLSAMPEMSMVDRCLRKPVRSVELLNLIDKLA